MTETPIAWVDQDVEQIQRILGLNKTATAALSGENKYLLFSYAPRMIEKMFEKAQDHSLQQYLALACWEGLKAIITGNNPVGALVVVREGGIEYIFAGHNQAESNGSKRHHAEQEAINAWEDQDHMKLMWKRKAPNEKDNVILVTTREPCAAYCTGRILTTKVTTSAGTKHIDTVMIGTKDTEGGGMCDGRENSLAPAFKKKWAQLGLRVITTDFDNPNAEGFVDDEFEGFLRKTYMLNRFETKDHSTTPTRLPLADKFNELPLEYSHGMLPDIERAIRKIK